MSCHFLFSSDEECKWHRKRTNSPADAGGLFTKLLLFSSFLVPDCTFFLRFPSNPRRYCNILPLHVLFCVFNIVEWQQGPMSHPSQPAGDGAPKCLTAPAPQSANTVVSINMRLWFSLLSVIHLRIVVVSCYEQFVLYRPSHCQLWHFAESGSARLFVFLSVWLTSGSWWWAGTGGRCPSASAASSWGWSTRRPSGRRGLSPPGMTFVSPEPGESTKELHSEAKSSRIERNCSKFTKLFGFSKLTSCAFCSWCLFPCSDTHTKKSLDTTQNVAEQKVKFTFRLLFV